MKSFSGYLVSFFDPGHSIQSYFDSPFWFYGLERHEARRISAIDTEMRRFQLLQFQSNFALAQSLSTVILGTNMSAKRVVERNLETLCPGAESIEDAVIRSCDRATDAVISCVQDKIRQQELKHRIRRIKSDILKPKIQ